MNQEEPPQTSRLDLASEVRGINPAPDAVSQVLSNGFELLFVTTDGYLRGLFARGTRDKSGILRPGRGS
jgi:hypothetical protein